MNAGIGQPHMPALPTCSNIIFNPFIFIFDLNLFSFKFKLCIQHLFKLKKNSYLNVFKTVQHQFKFLLNPVLHLNLNVQTVFNLMAIFL